MRLPRLLALLLPLLIGCSGVATTPSAASPSAASLTTSSTATSPPTSAPPSATPSSPAPSLPPGVPASFPRDLAPANVPPAALVPHGTEVAGTWFARTSAGDAIVIGWQVPGPDPFRLDHGLAVWRHFADGGAPWRPVYGRAYDAARTPVLGFSVSTQDVTGDGSDEALVVAETGGSGACGIVSVLDLASVTSIYRRSVCDTEVAPSTQPVGLELTQAVYAPGDAHCCPSAVRRTVLTFGPDGAWHVASSSTTPT